MTVSEARQLAMQFRARGEWEAAARTLEAAIAAGAGTGELAELWGMLGGTRREQGNLAEAVAAYDTGAGYESNAHTYNEVNRLVTRVLAEPRSLTDRSASGEGIPAMDVARALAAVQTRLRRTGDDGAGDDAPVDDLWSLGDLALTSALLGDAGTVDDAVQRWLAVDAPPAVVSRYRDTVAALADLDTPRKALLERMRDRLG